MSSYKLNVQRSQEKPSWGQAKKQEEQGELGRNEKSAQQESSETAKLPKVEDSKKPTRDTARSTTGYPTGKGPAATTAPLGTARWGFNPSGQPPQDKPNAEPVENIRPPPPQKDVDLKDPEKTRGKTWRDKQSPPPQKGNNLKDLSKTSGKTPQNRQPPPSQKDGKLEAKAKTATPKPQPPIRVSRLQADVRTKAMAEKQRKRVVKIRLPEDMEYWEFQFQMPRNGFRPGAAYRSWPLLDRSGRTLVLELYTPESANTAIEFIKSNDGEAVLDMADRPEPELDFDCRVLELHTGYQFTGDDQDQEYLDKLLKSLRNHGMRGELVHQLPRPNGSSIVLTFDEVEKTKIAYDLLAKHFPEIRVTKMQGPLGPYPTRTVPTQKDHTASLEGSSKWANSVIAQLIGVMVVMGLIIISIANP